MIKAIANQRLNLSKEEYEYYLELEKAFGPNPLAGMFKSDDKGQIISVTPSPAQPTAMMLIFFLLNLTHNQRLRKLDSWFKKQESLESRIVKLESKINEN